jgi:putative (di)nucleoside polyphosphate hydrolase
MTVELPPERFRDYRPAVGIMLLNRGGEVFVGRRCDMPPGEDAWQMPQGGIDDGETPRQAALRELAEETGVTAVEILGESTVWRHYDLPPAIAARMWNGRYRGQRQKWFAMRFAGDDSAIDLATPHPEFDAWQWVAPPRLPALIVPFKRRIYAEILAEFAPLWGDPGGGAR